MSGIPAVKLTWKGRRLAPRIWVRTSTGRFLFHTHPAAALELLELEAVEAVEEGKRLWCLTLLFTPGPIKQPLKMATLRSICASPAVVMAKQGDLSNWEGHKTYEFKRMNHHDRWAYVLAVTTTLRRA